MSAQTMSEPKIGNAEHEAIDGGFVCELCGAERRTPLGISRHRATCQRQTPGGGA